MIALARNLTPAIAFCRHCGGQAPAGANFCCGGCAVAFDLVSGLGLADFYQRRRFDPSQRPPRPDPPGAPRDLSAWVTREAETRSSLALLVDGLHCGACMWLIEQTLLRQQGVVSARVSLSTRRLRITWNPALARPEVLVGIVERLGYRLAPCAGPAETAEPDREGARLLRCLAVAGFATANIMLFSVSVWSGNAESISPGTRDLFHWVSALIALPAIAYAGRPFFSSAFRALRARHANMDVPISLAVILAPAVSLHETFTSGPHAYFDSAVTLLFFLLVGRYLDHRARQAARLGAQHLLTLGAGVATVIGEDGARHDLPPRELRPGMIALVAPGSRIPADGLVIEGISDVDTSLVSGESAPCAVAAGAEVFAGTLNLTGPLRVRVEKADEATLLSEIVRLIEAAEARRGRYVRLADRVARHYAPVVHVAALSTFLGWTLIGGLAWQEALMIAVSVLIITCPCALALAVPVVQVVASRRLMRSGVHLKAADALERLAAIDHVVLDKTGTLTLGRPTLVEGTDSRQLKIAAAIAANSRHPLARALAAGCPVAAPASPIEERPGEGLIWHAPDGEWRLGSATFVGLGRPKTQGSANHLSVYLRDPAGSLARFEFQDRLRPDAKETCAALSREYPIEICSGDRAPIVSRTAAQIGVADWRAEMSPAAKNERLRTLASRGRRVLMVGDGLNDAPSLAAASASMSPTTGADLAQVKADLVFQGDRLAAIRLALGTARAAGRLMRQNLALALFYNLAAVPLAVAGYVTPLVAALAMSSSSILVVANALRLGRIPEPDGETA